MELRHLRYFVTVADELHFGRAAERLHIAQPPLSQQIRRLEEELGVQLLERSKRHVRLTPAGRVFLQQARQTLIQAEQAAQSARRAARGETGRLELGFLGSTSYNLLPPVLRLFRQKLPDVEVVLHELSSQEQMQAIKDRKLHVGLVRPPIEDDLLARECLLHEALMVALPEDHGLAAQEAIAPALLNDEPFVLLPRALGVQYYDQVVGLCRRAGFSPRIVQEASHLPTVVSLVAAGLGVSLLPESLRNLRRCGVVFRPLEGVPPRITLAMTWRREDADPLLHSFLEVVREVVLQYGRDTGSNCSA